MSEQRRFYTVKQVAERWQCSASKVQKMTSRGELGHIKIGATIRIPEESITNYEDNAWQDQNLQNQDSASEESKESLSGTSSGHGKENLTAYQRAQKMKSQQNSLQ